MWHISEEQLNLFPLVPFLHQVCHAWPSALPLKMTIGPFPLTQIVALIWVAIRSATQISATIFIFMCGDRKVAIISAILIAIRAPLIVRLFENNRDYFLCEVCENGERKSYRFFISHHARRALRSSCLRALCVYKQYTCIARTGAIWVAIFLPVWTRVKNSRDSNRAFFGLCGHAQK